jgi:hypothetical protein
VSLAFQELDECRMLMVRTALSRFKDEATGRRKRALDRLLGDEKTKFREVKGTTFSSSIFNRN